MNTKKLKSQIGKIVDGMIELETKMARASHFGGPADRIQVASWVEESCKLSSRLDKVWKSVKDKPKKKQSKARKDGLRAHTPEELRIRLFQHMFMLCNYWSKVHSKSEVERMEGLCHSILTYIDGCSMNSPAMDLVVRPHSSDKAFHISEGSNWFENGTVVNDCILNDIFFKYKPINKTNS